MANTNGSYCSSYLDHDDICTSVLEQRPVPWLCCCNIFKGYWVFFFFAAEFSVETSNAEMCMRKVSDDEQASFQIQGGGEKT